MGGKGERGSGGGRVVYEMCVCVCVWGGDMYLRTYCTHSSTMS